MRITAPQPLLSLIGDSIEPSSPLASADIQVPLGARLAWSSRSETSQPSAAGLAASGSGSATPCVCSQRRYACQTNVADAPPSAPGPLQAIDV
jgi:hypothetical protein